MASVVPFALSTTAATPALSDAVALNCSRVPGAAWLGAFIVTSGLTVSGSATTASMTDAALLFPAASRAVAPIL